MDSESTAPTRPRIGPATARTFDVSPVSPTRIGRYAILGLLGRGGMCDVYLGQDDRLRHQVAIKLLKSRDDASTAPDWLRREARALSRLAHPNVVALHEVGEADGRVYLAMERVDGVTLRAWLSEPERSLAETLGVMLQAGEGLAAAHAVGLIHRDFKPDNVMIGTDCRVRLMDFGLACSVDGPTATLSPMTSSAGRIAQGGRAWRGHGTPGYMAPEQRLDAPQDARCDIFSFCVVLFEAMHGRRPCSDAYPRALQRAPLERVLAPDDRAVSARLDAVIRRGLAEEPRHRWTTMNELLGVLARALRRPSRSARTCGAPTCRVFDEHDHCRPSGS